MPQLYLTLGSMSGKSSSVFQLSPEVNLPHRVASILDLQNNTEISLYITFTLALKFVGEDDYTHEGKSYLNQHFIEVNEHYSRESHHIIQRRKVDFLLVPLLNLCFLFCSCLISFLLLLLVWSFRYI